MFGGGGSEGLDQVPSTQGLARPVVLLSTAHPGGRALPSSKARSGQGAAGERWWAWRRACQGCPNNVRTQASKSFTVS